MRLIHETWSHKNSFSSKANLEIDSKVQLIFYSSAHPLEENSPFLTSCRQRYPNAHLIGCYRDQCVLSPSETIELQGVIIEATDLRLIVVRNNPGVNGQQAGQRIGAFLKEENLSGMMLLADMKDIKDEGLLQGLNDQIPAHLPIFNLFMQRVLLGCNFIPQERQIIAIGFYGQTFPIDSLKTQLIFNTL